MQTANDHSQWLNYALKKNWPIILRIMLILNGTYYSKNYASILYLALARTSVYILYQSNIIQTDAIYTATSSNCH